MEFERPGRPAIITSLTVDPFPFVLPLNTPPTTGFFFFFWLRDRDFSLLGLYIQSVASRTRIGASIPNFHWWIQGANMLLLIPNTFVARRLGLRRHGRQPCCSTQREAQNAKKQARCCEHSKYKNNTNNYGRHDVLKLMIPASNSFSGYGGWARGHDWPSSKVRLNGK